MAVITTSYYNLASVVERDLKNMIVADLRKRLMEVAIKEIDEVIMSVAGDMVSRVSEVKSWDVGGITLQVAINGVRKDAP